MIPIAFSQPDFGRFKRLPRHTPICKAQISVRAVMGRRTVGGYQLDDQLARQSLCLEACGQNATLYLSVPTLGRGVYKLSYVDVLTCMPFGLAWAIRRIRSI